MCETPGVTGEVRAALREGALVLRGAISAKLPLDELRDVRPGVFGLTFVYQDGMYRLRMGAADAIDWAGRMGRK